MLIYVVKYLEHMEKIPRQNIRKEEENIVIILQY